MRVDRRHNGVGSPVEFAKDGDEAAPIGNPTKEIHHCFFQHRQTGDEVRGDAPTEEAASQRLASPRHVMALLFSACYLLYCARKPATSVPGLVGATDLCCSKLDHGSRLVLIGRSGATSAHHLTLANA